MAQKIKRDAFLYLEPKGAKSSSSFAQCSTCMMWTGEGGGPNPKRCHVHGPKLEITGDHTCGFYIQGKPMPEGPIMASVTPEESGLEKREVRCENCRSFRTWGQRGRCHLYTTLNEDVNGHFALETAVHPYGCCNANTPKP